MSKVTKKELQYQINRLAAEASTRHNSIMRIHRALASIGVDIFSDDFDLTEPEPQPQPQLKQLDQSVFGGLDEKWRFAAVVADGRAMYFNKRPYDASEEVGFFVFTGDYRSKFAGENYDTSNWQNSLIERDIARELLEVDLSSELTGSDLAVKYFESNERHICFVGEDNDGCLSDLMIAMVVGYNEYRGFMTSYNDWFPFVTLINNQGEPLTASEVGL